MRIFGMFALMIGVESAGAQIKGVVASDTSSKVYLEFQVERPVRRAATALQPAYPAELKKLGTEAEVQAQFVVDTLGIADLSSFKVLQSPHELFSKAVMGAVAQTIYEPAEIQGRKVKQRVVQRFFFAAPR